MAAVETDSRRTAVGAASNGALITLASCCIQEVSISFITYSTYCQVMTITAVENWTACAQINRRIKKSIIGA